MSRSRALWALLGAVAAIAIAPVAFVEILDVPPRELARYVEKRASGHNPLIERTGSWIANELRRPDRGVVAPVAPDTLSALPVGAHDAGPREPAREQAAGGAVVPVLTAAALEEAIARADPGQVITLAPGVYRFGGRANVDVGRPGRDGAPITVRADVPGTALVEFDMTEGFRVSAPYWTFENLHIRGVCAAQSACEHAFHVVGKAARFVARNNTVVDFNAHFKINGESRDFPDGGVIEGNTLVNRSVRETDSPVTPVDLVAASGWKITGNLIADFVKGQGDRTSFGAFAKGGGADTLIERNVVICEHALRGQPGQRVGLSIGGGGSGNQYCRDGDCRVEHFRGAIRANLIQSCSDDGIYVNRGEGVSIAHNTLLDTGGISVRFSRSEALVEGNLIDGLLRARDGARIRSSDNFGTRATQLYFGAHPVRALFRNLEAGSLEWKTVPPRRASGGDTGNDLCDVRRPAPPAYGAIEGVAACVRR
jgi:hypothetical protein